MMLDQKSLKISSVIQTPRMTKHIAKYTPKVSIPKDTPYTFCSLKPTQKYITKTQANIIDENCYYFATENGAVGAVLTKPLLFSSKRNFNIFVETGKGAFEFYTGEKSESLVGDRPLRAKFASSNYNEVFELVEVPKYKITPYSLDMDVPQQISPIKVLTVNGPSKEVDVEYVDGKPHMLKKVVNNRRIKNLLKFIEEHNCFPYTPNNGFHKVIDSKDNMTLEKALRLGVNKRILNKEVAYLIPNYNHSEFISLMFKSKKKLYEMSNFLRFSGIQHHYWLTTQFYKANDDNGKIHLSQTPISGYCLIIEFEKIDNNVIIPGFTDYNTGKKDFTFRELVPTLSAWGSKFGAILLDKAPNQAYCKTVRGSLLNVTDLLKTLGVCRDMKYACKRYLNTTPRGAAKGARGLCENSNNILKVTCSLTRNIRDLTADQAKSIIDNVSEVFEKTKTTQHHMTEQAKVRMAQRIVTLDRYTRGSIGCSYGSPILELRKKEYKQDLSEFVILLRRLDLKYSLQT